MRFAALLSVTTALLAGIAVAPSQTPKETGEISFREGLAIPPVGRAGRSAVHTDAIEHQIVLGKWKPPKAGDEVKPPDGAVRKWEPIKAGDDGWFSGRALTGGYAYFSIPSKEKRVMMLDASGHGMVYVNGEPRVGDPYQTGYVRLPVELKAGENHFLFQGGRGRLRAKLVAPKGRAQFDTGDLTLPDLLVGEEAKLWAAIPVLNNQSKALSKAVLQAAVDGAEPVRTPIGPILPLALRKCGFQVKTPAATAAGEVTVEVKLFADDTTTDPLDTGKVKLRVVGPTATRKVTFISDIDGSVQYYAVTPMANSTLKEGEKPALFLTLHGAGVEALGQASCYSNKTWGHVVAPTNRRPFGFDWEDWGRLDAMEVLAHAQKSLQTDPRRTYLTGHSMGGHGVWQLGALYPDRWAAIAPSAGWISMYSYAGARRPENPDARQEMLLRAASTSDTLAMLKNYGQHGVYVLHGEKDDNVPVGQAREMRKQLATFHSDFVYYERPGAGHWWGNECVDWPPIFEFFARRTKPEAKDVRQAEFTTMNPGVSSRAQWASVLARACPLKPSTIRVGQDSEKRCLNITTENVAVLAVYCDDLNLKEPFAAEIDGTKFEGLTGSITGILTVKRDGTKWERCSDFGEASKGPPRSGPFKDAFRTRMAFIYGTKGLPEENAWALAKVRYDAEVFWYRGNGSINVIPDTEFNPKNPLSAKFLLDRSVILYGNSFLNAAWAASLGEGPIQVNRSAVQVGSREATGDDLACLFVRPRLGNRSAYIAAVGGTGLAGMRLTDRIPIFVSGVGIPDLLVLDSSSLEKGSDGIRVAGFFGNDWSVEKGDFAWRDGYAK